MSGVAAIVQAACTVNAMGIVCGVPAAACPTLSVPVSVIVALYVPGISEPNNVAVTLIEADCRAVRLPVAGVTASQFPPTAVAMVAFQLSVPPPLLVIVIVWAAGDGCPITPANFKPVVGFERIGAVGCPSTNVIGSVCVPLAELKTTEPVYVPGVSPLVLMPTTGYVGVVPLVALNAIQSALLTAFHLIGVVQP